MTNRSLYSLIKVSLLFGLISLGGCAFTEDTVDIKYNPPANLAVVPGAEAVPIEIVGQDGRFANKDRVGSKKNGYGMETARIISKVDVVKVFRDAVEHELNSFGFRSGPDGLRVVVEVDTFYNDFKMGVFSGDAVAEASFNLTLYAPNGALLYAHAYKSVGMNKNIALASGSSAQPALQQALTSAMQSLANDAALQAALQSAEGLVTTGKTATGKQTS